MVVNLGYFSAENTGILPYKTDKWFPLCDIMHKFRSNRPEWYIIITYELELVKLGNECLYLY